MRVEGFFFLRIYHMTIFVCCRPCPFQNPEKSLSFFSFRLCYAILNNLYSLTELWLRMFLPRIGPGFLT